MGRRILAFFLGLLVGIVFVFGALALALYIAVTVVTPNDVYPDSNKFLGDLADMSLYDIYQSIADLYAEKVGLTDENGNYFTLGQFCEHYNINPSDLFGGKEVPQDVLDIPVFEFFAEDGTDPAMQQVKVSAFFALFNMFVSGEDGSGFFTQTTLNKLALHNMAELFDEEKGFSYVFEEVLLVDLMPGTFPEEKVEDNAAMWAFGQTSVGRLLGGFEDKVLLEFKESGIFETMGSLKMKELLGNSGALVSAMFGNYNFADLIDDDGNLNIDGLVDKMYLGDLFGYQRGLFVGDTSEFTLLCGDEERAVLYRGEGEDIEYLLRLKVASDGEMYDYYTAKLTCTTPAHTHGEDCAVDEQGSYLCGHIAHAHDTDCFGYIWYKCGLSESDGHGHSEGCLATGMMGLLSNEMVSDLSNLSDKIMSFTLKDVLGDNVPQALKSIENTPLSDLENAIDGMYLGDMLEYIRVIPDNLDEYRDLEGAENIRFYTNGDGETLYAMRDEINGNWYSARLDCTATSHLRNGHNEDCFDFIWYGASADDASTYIEIKGVMGKLASILIGDMSADGLTRIINNTRLGEVINTEGSTLLSELSDVKIGELGTELNNLYVGTAMGYHRKEAASDYAPNDSDRVRNTSSVYIYDNGGETVYYKYHARKDKYYVAQLTCVEKDRAHVHDDNCYGYIWYNCESAEHAHNDDCVVRGLNGKMANLSMNELSNGELDNILRSLTMRDLIDSGILNLNDDDSAYKFAIIFCGENNHSCNGDDPAHKCTLSGYFAYQTQFVGSDNTATAQDFWLHTHNYANEGELDENGIAHRDAWEDTSLTEFINKLLGAF